MIVTELLKNLENVNINTLLQEIDEHCQFLINEYRENADIRLLSQIQKIQNLADLLNHKMMNKLSLLINEFSLESQKNNLPFSETIKSSKTIIRRTKRINSPINEMVDNYHKDNSLHPIPKIDNQESGDIHFAATIVPYKLSYIRELCRTGKIPYDRPAGKYVFSREKLENWLAQNSDDKMSRFKIGRKSLRG